MPTCAGSQLWIVPPGSIHRWERYYSDQFVGNWGHGIGGWRVSCPAGAGHEPDPVYRGPNFLQIDQTPYGDLCVGSQIVIHDRLARELPRRGRERARLE